MGVKDGFMGASIIMKLVCVFLIIALFCIWIAITCTGWGENDITNGMHIGLWRACTGHNTIGGCSELDGVATDWFAYAQASAVFAFIGINVTALLVVLIMFSSSCKGNKECGIGGAILCLVTGVLFLIGIIVFGVEFKDNYIDNNNSNLNLNYEYSYAFGLAIPGCLLEIVVGVLLLVENCKGGTSPSG